jgi:hypothetical protein
MKTVFSSSREIPHLWAHQTQSSARAGNVSFEGLKFYSYRTVIAQLVETKPGQFVAVFDSCRYSVSTAKHKGLALFATSHLARYYVRRARKGNDSLTPNASDLSEKLREISDTIKECEAGRGSHKARFERMQSLPARVEQVREFAKVFKLGALSLSNDIKKALKPETLAEYQARAAKADAARNTPAAIAKRAKGAEYRARKKAAQEAEAKERRAAALREAMQRNAEHVAQWRAGTSNHIPYAYGVEMPVMVRLIQDDGRDVVETSKGARVPLSSALKLFSYCQRVRELGREFIPSQEFKVGHYALQMITAEGAARVGCHLLPFDEMAALFAKLSPEQIAGGANA